MSWSVSFTGKKTVAVGEVAKQFALAEQAVRHSQDETADVLAADRSIRSAFGYFEDDATVDVKAYGSRGTNSCSTHAQISLAPTTPTT